MKKLMSVLEEKDDNKKNEELSKIIESALNDKQKKKLEETINNRGLTEKLLSSDEAKKLLKKLSEGE